MRIRSNSALRLSQVHLLLFAVLFLASELRAQVPAPPTAPAASAPASNRPCGANPVLAPSRKDKASKQSKHSIAPEPPPACIEIKGEAIEIQEFLQSTAREEQWRVAENRASDDTWSFVRYLSADEVEKYADTKVLIETVNFEGGKVAVGVRTTELGDGYVRIQVAAHFQGEGKSSDKVWAQPGNLWPLNSKGLLEQELIDSLLTRYKHLS